MRSHDEYNKLNEWQLRTEPIVIHYRAAESDTSPMPQKQPFFSTADRITFIEKGTMDISVNMHPFSVDSGHILYTAKGSIILIDSESKDLELFSCALAVKPNGQMHPHHRVFLADQGLRVRIHHYFELLLPTPGCNPQPTMYLQQALLAEVFNAATLKETISHPTYGQRIYNSFIELAGEYAIGHRNVDFYAERLNISPSRLMKIVKSVSSRTVLQWIDLRTTLQAKSLLAYSDKTIAEIAYELGMDDANYFSRYFKHQTGMTPSAYRKGVESNTGYAPYSA